MRMKEYEHPQIELVLFEEMDDVITTSGGLNIGGGGDGTVTPMSEEGKESF